MMHRRALLAAGAALLAAGPGRRSEALRRGPSDQHLEGREASWYRKLSDGRVECQLCPRACQVADAERGACGVRENRRGTYYTLVHSLPCTVHVDAIEKKPFYHLLPGARAFSWATAGCNVECKFCQNWEISQFRPEQVANFWLAPDALARRAREVGAFLLSATYSEPVVFWEYVRDVAVAARFLGMRTTVVTNGYIAEQPLKEVLPHLAAVKVDLKSFREEFYRQLVRGELKPVLRALEVIRMAKVWLEIVVLLIPTLNDSEAEIRDLARWVKANLGSQVPVHFSRFHPTYRLTNLPPTPVATLERAHAIARTEGLEYVYLGNLPGHPAANTHCPGCGELLIRRAGFTVRENRMRRGACSACGRAIPGIWA